jgi:alpha,alpha-trehalose phosphorylase
VRVGPEQATYTLTTGEPLEIGHHGEQLTVADGQPQVRAIPPAPAREAPTQPAGRAPDRGGRPG